ncbi:sigma 54 modulation/S30EA ribosomal C-terminal domain-containing protein [Catellatospora coxensis]|nr:sigma 54 modulation/S30EA ribosomal C-terminal domain-containing protein [Catellatospora coxensis]
MASPGSRPVPRQGGVRVELCTRGEVDPGFADLTRQAVAAVVAADANAAGPVRLRITVGKQLPGPTLIQVNLQVRGEPARIQISARSPYTAATAAFDRLERQIHRLAQSMDSATSPLPFRRRLAVPGEGAIARLKAVRLQTATAAQAAMRLSAMDYEAHLFTAADAGADAVIYRSGYDQLRVTRQGTTSSSRIPAAIQVDTRPAAVLDPAEAAQRLATNAVPFIFYTDRGTGRGNLLYRRHDGDLGLISPITPDASPQPPSAAGAQADAAAAAGHCESRPSQDAVGMLLEIANSRTANARSSTAAPV